MEGLTRTNKGGMYQPISITSTGNALGDQPTEAEPTVLVPTVVTDLVSLGLIAGYLRAEALVADLGLHAGSDHRGAVESAKVALKHYGLWPLSTLHIGVLGFQLPGRTVYLKYGVLLEAAGPAGETGPAGEAGEEEAVDGNPAEEESTGQPPAASKPTKNLKRQRQDRDSPDEEEGERGKKGPGRTVVTSAR